MRELNEMLFYPKKEELIGVIAEAIKNKEKKLQFFSDFDGDVWEALNYVTEKYFEPNKEFNLKYVWEVIKEIAITYDMLRFHISTFLNKDEKMESSTSYDDNIFGEGILDEDYEYTENDPYETAGGYRIWKALKGDKCYYRLNKDLTVTVEFVSSCIIDHYNNNIGGLSTGGGTSKYEIGEMTGVNSVVMGREYRYKEWNKQKIASSPEFINYNKLIELCKKYTPEFEFLFPV